MSELQHGFDEALISGYLDGELTQGEEQRVRLHLEDCAECKSMTDELRRLKEATMTTEFREPEDTQWDETPRGPGSGFFRTFGWLILLAWIVGTVGYGLWQTAIDTEDLFEVIIVFGFWLGFGLVFLSVLIDRLKTRKTDRYRRVQK
ncbi:MAG: zf-HC2 domain-containing protein [Acidimicrobiia bacterium]|nr:zf-HC2 domain-containing protein [Acidimicrobiia bacterium]MDH3399198.1 zf-HC2 domain-containing protein [Acidimicrobiia bacterium]